MSNVSTPFFSLKQRLHGMDFCRAVLMSLGLFYHCGLIYGINDWWRVHSEQNSYWITLFSDIIHDFRMEAFYLISGLFYCLVFAKKKGGFLKDRVSRVLVPMLFVGATLNYVMNMYSYNFDFSSGYAYILKGEWLGHLWFLGNLLIYFVCSAKICEIVMRHHQFFYKNYYFLLFALYCSSCLLGFVSVYMDDFNIILFKPSSLIYYFPYFLMGVLSYCCRDKFYHLIRLKYTPVYFIIYFAFQYVYYNYLGRGVLSNTFSLMSHFVLVLGVMGVLDCFGKKESVLIKYFSRSSYTVYLLHQPLMVFLYVFIFAEVDFNAYVEYFALIFLVFAISIWFHFSIVEKSGLLKFALNGTPYFNRSAKSA